MPINKRAFREAVELAEITVEFTSKIKEFSKKECLPYKETLIQIISSIIEVEELTDNAN